MAYGEHQVGSRIAAVAWVGLVHAIVGYVLVTGLTYKALEKATDKVALVSVAVRPPAEVLPAPPEQVRSPLKGAAPLLEGAKPPVDLSPPRPMVNVTTVIVPRVVPQSGAPPLPVGPEISPRSGPPLSSRAREPSPDDMIRWTRQIAGNLSSQSALAGIEGRTWVTVKVGADGRVTACAVSATSGSSALDEASCDGMKLFATFIPALNEAGDATAGSYSTELVRRLK